MSGRTYDELEVGQFAEETGAVTEEAVRAFAELTGDRNPVHLDAEYAGSTRFRRPIAHGMLVASRFSRLIGMDLPGLGTLYLSQSLKFLAPVYPGDVVTARVEVVGKPNGKHVLLRTTCRNQADELVVDGEALVSPPRARPAGA